ncbi:MAG: ABC transporter permease subunit [Oscillospiraceae bacterium]|nr:ABC transporter permease subunit [Oscillospiraceae bacterium]MCL2278534.1 ABC transporter permease subunit [Oscillospiraceae bacterium]
MKKTLRRVWAQRYIYILFFPAVIFLVLFAYAPMFNLQTGGILMAFTRFSMRASNFFELEWVGFHWFNVLFNRPDFLNAFFNTLLISFGRLLIEFPVPIVLAIVMNEVRRNAPKRIFQTIFTFPNFLSWVLIYAVLQDLFQFTGAINAVRGLLGLDPVLFLSHSSSALNYGLIFGSSIWRGAGWGAIIYMASITGIDPSLYEAAKVDGANRWHCIRHVTWPGIKPTVVVLLVLAVGNAMAGGFDQIFQFINAVNRPTLEIIDTYVFSFAFGQGGMNQSFAAAAGLFQAVINFLLLLSANKMMKLLGTDGLF